MNDAPFAGPVLFEYDSNFQFWGNVANREEKHRAGSEPIVTKLVVQVHYVVLTDVSGFNGA